MSYEGYSQFLCPKGHEFSVDCYSTADALEKNLCPHCGLGAVWENMVDITNGSFEDGKRIDSYIELEVLTEKKCECCGSVLERTFKKP